MRHFGSLTIQHISVKKGREEGNRISSEMYKEKRNLDTHRFTQFICESERDDDDDDVCLCPRAQCPRKVGARAVCLPAATPFLSASSCQRTCRHRSRASMATCDMSSRPSSTGPGSSTTPRSATSPSSASSTSIPSPTPR